MNNFHFVMLANVAIKSIYAACVTVAAVCFDKPSILWWYVLLLFLGWDYKEIPSKNIEENKNDSETDSV